MKMQSALPQINFLAITWFYNIYPLTPPQNTSCSPILKFQAMHQLGHDILRHISVVPPQYTATAEMWPKEHTLTVESINGSYMLLLHSSNHQAVYMRRGKFVPVAYIFI